MNTSRRPIVQVKQGKVQGAMQQNVDGDEFLVFNGIPYAQPPVGELRFKDPLPAKSGYGILNRGSNDRKPAQYDIIMQFYTGTEDCLYLNIATNSLDGKRPVMVWVHGGGFTMSSASFKLYGADYLLKQDIVFVSIGYRLACLGFLNLGLPDASGNQGMKDLVAGLKWIQENIEQFGGDSGNVTICGQSAGGAAVHLLTISPLAEGLFHKAIIQSNVAINHWTFSENPVEMGLSLASILSNKSVNDPSEALDILMKIPTEQLIKAQRQMSLKLKDYEAEFLFIPSVDSKTTINGCGQPFMPKHPKEIAKRGINVPLIIGSVADEGIFLASGPTMPLAYQDINNNFAAVIARMLRITKIDGPAKIEKIVRKFYFGDSDPITPGKNHNGFIRMMGDLYFYNGIQQVIEIQSQISTPTYVYQFSYRPSYPTLRSVMKNNLEGSGHGDELGALFHSQCYMRDMGLQKGTKDYLVMERLTQMWANFAKTGNPTPKLNEKLTTKWEPITENKKNFLEISDELEPSANFGEASWKFWKPILETL